MKNYNLYQHTSVDTTRELIDFCAKNYQQKTAFVFQNKKQDIFVSFEEFKIQVCDLGTYFLKTGFTKAHIALFGENSYAWILTHFAVTSSGNIIIPIDKELSCEGIIELLLDSETQVFVYSDTYFDIAEQLAEKLPYIIYINWKDMAEYIQKGRQFMEQGCTDFINMSLNKDTLASIVYTSGTTGKAKGVMLTHHNFLSCMYGACCNVWLAGGSLLLLPLHHTFGLVAGVFAVMYHGYPVYINKSLKRISEDFIKYRPQNVFVVPLIVENLYSAIWSAIQKQKKEKVVKFLIKISDTLLKYGIDIRKKLFSTLRSSLGGNLELIISGGAPLNEKYVKAFSSLGISVLNGYGITECGPIVAVNRNEKNMIGSVGLPLCCNEVLIADDGEILVKGDNVMLGYYKRKAENYKVFHNGWFLTGDIGRMDADGYLYITGRKKNLIILANGENISAESIEQEIYTFDYVKECIVYGEEDKIVAEVYLEEIADAEKLIHKDIQMLNQHLPQNRNIHKILIRKSEFPKTTTKKIKRNYENK